MIEDTLSAVGDSQLFLLDESFKMIVFYSAKKLMWPLSLDFFKQIFFC